METKIYFYLHNQVSKKTGKQKIYCKIKAGNYKAILLPLKQTPDSKTLACKEIDFISKNNNYLCTEIENASLINFTIIQYQERATRAIEQLSKHQHVITRETIEPYIFNKFKTPDNQIDTTNMTFDDLPDVLTGNFPDPDMVSTPDEIERALDSTGKLQREHDKKMGYSSFVFDYLDKYYAEIEAKANKKSTLKSFKIYCENLRIGDIDFKQFKQDLHSNFITHLKNNPRILKNGDVKQYSARTLKSYSIEIVAYANWLSNNTDYQNEDIKLISYNTRNKNGDIVSYKVDTKGKLETCLEMKELKEFLALDLSNENDKMKLVKDMFHLQMLMGGARFKTVRFNLIKDNIREFEGNKALKTNNGNKRDDNILMTDEAIAIAEKYNYDFKISLKTYNTYLQKIATKLNWNRTIFLKENLVNAKGATTVKKELKEDFSSHYARHTAVSLLASKGYSLDRIVDITKHSYETVRYYLKFYDADRLELQKEFTKL